MRREATRTLPAVGAGPVHAGVSPIPRDPRFAVAWTRARARATTRVTMRATTARVTSCAREGHRARVRGGRKSTGVTSTPPRATLDVDAAPDATATTTTALVGEDDAKARAWVHGGAATARALGVACACAARDARAASEALGDVALDPESARAVSAVLGPLFSLSTVLFIVRIVMTWYPSVPYTKLPWVVAYAPTEPLLKPTRALVPPVGGVDVSPIIWVGMISFMNEILLGKQGLLVLLANKQLG